MAQPAPDQAGVTKPMGVGALLRGKPAAKAQKPTPEMVQAMKKPPALATEIAPQSFYGDPPQQEVAAAAAPRAMAPSLPVYRPTVPPAASLVAASFVAPTSLKFASVAKPKKPKAADFDRPDFKEKDREIDEQDDFDDYLPQEFLDYQKKQAEIEDIDPYLTKTLVYTPQSRKSFYRFVNKNYGDVFRLLPQIKGLDESLKKIEEELCKILMIIPNVPHESVVYGTGS